MKAEILKTLEAHMLMNSDFLTLDEIADIEKQIAYLKSEIRKEAHQKYVSQLKAFSAFMGNTFERYMGDDCTNETVDIFYNSAFKIEWRGRTVTLCNGAEVFQGIEEIIQTEIDNEEEI